MAANAEGAQLRPGDRVVPADSWHGTATSVIVLEEQLPPGKFPPAEDVASRFTVTAGQVGVVIAAPRPMWAALAKMSGYACAAVAVVFVAFPTGFGWFALGDVELVP